MTIAVFVPIGNLTIAGYSPSSRLCQRSQSCRIVTECEVARASGAAVRRRRVVGVSTSARALVLGRHRGLTYDTSMCHPCNMAQITVRVSENRLAAAQKVIDALQLLSDAPLRKSRRSITDSGLRDFVLSIRAKISGMNPASNKRAAYESAVELLVEAMQLTRKADQEATMSEISQAIDGMFPSIPGGQPELFSTKEKPTETALPEAQADRREAVSLAGPA